ncbi:MAG: site-2 protease family protein [Vicinamibacterales bacterium]
MQGIDVAQIFIVFIVLLFSLTVHEAAHAWTADRLGDPTARLLQRVSLNPMVHADLMGTVVFPLIAMIGNVPLLGWAKPVPVVTSRLRNPRRDFMLVAAAGPASNLVLAVLAAVGLKILVLMPSGTDGPEIATPLAMFLIRLVGLNVTLALFNLLPIPPLDGGNVARGLLPPAVAAKYDGLMRPYGFILLYALLLSGVVNYLVLRPAGVLTSFLLSSVIAS